MTVVAGVVQPLHLRISLAVLNWISKGVLSGAWFLGRRLAGKKNKMERIVRSLRRESRSNTRGYGGLGMKECGYRRAIQGEKRPKAQKEGDSVDSRKRRI